MAEKLKIRKLFSLAVALICLAGILYVGRGYYYGAMTVHELLTENKQLKQAITNITLEDQIGYAKVISQQFSQGKLFTTIKFVETARDDKLQKLFEKEFTIQGDIVYFDALIVTFGDKMVLDGREKALYLWRRLYDESTAPENAVLLSQTDKAPVRYNDLLELLPADQRDLFWSNIWSLANDPEKLSQYDIKAVYGSAVYTKLENGLVYVFKITPAGQIYPETTPDIWQ